MKKSKKGYRIAVIVLSLIYLAVLVVEGILYSKHAWYNSWHYVLNVEMLPTVAVILLVIHSIIVYKNKNLFALPAISALILAAASAFTDIYSNVLIPPRYEYLAMVGYDMTGYKPWFWTATGQLVSAVLYLAIAIIIIARFKCPTVVLLTSLALGVFSSVANGLSIFEYCQYNYADMNTYMVIGIAGCGLILEFVVAMFFVALAIYRMKNSPKKLYARSIEERLHDAQNEFSSGRITEEEYAEKRKQIIASIHIKENVIDDFKNYGEE